MKPDTKNTGKLRKKYTDSPPGGMTPADICSMSDEELLDMDYFLHEDVFGDEGCGEDGFYIF